MRASITTLGWTTWCLLAAACGDSGGSSASDSGGSTSRGTDTAGAASTSEGSASATDSATAPTEGGGSISDSQATTDATASASDSSATATVGTTEGGSATAPGTDTGETTQAGSASEGSTGTTGGPDTSGSTTDAPPAICGEPPAGFDGPQNANCEIPPKVGTFTPTVEWSKSSWAAFPQFNQVMVAPIVVSLTDDNADGKIDDDDIPDIVFTTFAGFAYTSTGVLRAVSGKDGAEILNIGDQSIGGSAGVAGGDIDGDGIVELVTTTTTGQVKAFEHTGELKWATPNGTSLDFGSYPAIADMDGDGKPEIVSGPAILNNDGTLRGKVKYGVGSLASVVADIDLDGTLEMVAGNAVYKPNGAEVWYNGKTDGWVGVADINLDDSPDIVVVGDNAIRRQDNKGAVLWQVVMPGGGGGPPTIADYDGDGQPEIGVAGAAFYVVFEPDGKVLWQKATQDLSSQVTGSSVFDFEGDGAAEVIYNDELRLRVYAGTNGAEKLNLNGYGSATLFEYPIVVDVDNDGQSEIVAINNNSFGFGNKTGVTVIGDMNKSWRPARKIWNQHAYSITKDIRLS